MPRRRVPHDQHAAFPAERGGVRQFLAGRSELVETGEIFTIHGVVVDEFADPWLVDATEVSRPDSHDGPLRGGPRLCPSRSPPRQEASCTASQQKDDVPSQSQKAPQVEEVAQVV